jgi:hypothetical protein
MNGSFVALRSHHIPIPHFVVNSYKHFETHQTNLALLNLHKMQEYIVHQKHEVIPYEFQLQSQGYDELILRDLQIMCINKHNSLQGRENDEQMIAWRFHYNGDLLAVSDIHYINHDGFLTQPLNCKKTHFIRFERISYLLPQDGVTYFLRDHVAKVYGKEKSMPNFNAPDSFSQDYFDLAKESMIEQMSHKYSELLYFDNSQNGLSFDTNISNIIQNMKLK